MRFAELLEEVLHLAIRVAAEETFTNMPVKVQSRSGSFVDVVPQVRRPIESAEGGMVYEDYPVIPNVPIAFPQAAGGFYFTWDVQPGSFGILVASKHSLAEWRRDGIVSSPGDHRLHHLGSGWFLPQASPDKDAPAIVAGKLVIEAPEILLGKNAVDPVANATKVDQQFQDVATAIGSLTANLTSGAVVAGTPFVPSSTGASKVKVE